MDASQKQGFTGVDVADTGDDPGIHDQVLDRGFCARGFFDATSRR